MNFNWMPQYDQAMGLVSRRLSVFDRLRCERVYHGWQQAIQDVGWAEQRKLDLDTVFEGVPKEEVADRRIRFWANGYKNLILLFTRTGKDLRELDLSSFVGEDLVPFIDQIAGAFSHLRGLQTLNIRLFELADFVEFLPPTLRRLKTYQFDVQTLEKLSRKCPKLEKVPFRWVEGLTLELLSEFIGRFPSQRSLTIPFMYGDNVPFSRFEGLNFKFDKGKSNAKTVEGIVRLEKLVALNIRHWYSLDAESFGAIVSGCPGLRRFSFPAGKLTEEALLQLAQMPSLVDLEIEGYGVEAFTHDVLKAIANRGQLKSLVFQHSKLTDESVEYLLHTCKSLVTLNLFRSCLITDRSLEAVIAELHQRHGNPPRALPTGPLDPGIFFFPCVGEEGFSFDAEMSYRELEGEWMNSVNWEWAKAEAANNPWLYVHEHIGKRRKFY